MKPFWGEHEAGEHPHMEVTEAIIGAAIQVQKALGPGLLEEPYKACLAHTLREKGHKVLREVRLDLAYEGLHIPDAYILDLVVDGKVVVEAKAVDRLADVHVAQVNSYLRFSGLEVGLLLNFRAWPLKEGLKRMVSTQACSFSSAPPHLRVLQSRLFIW
jgi:GxxExxY protein